MQIFPVGAESLGVRSFAVFIHTKDVNIFIDPSVSLAPLRYGLSPHEVEIALSWQIRQNITALSQHTDIIILTHYHADHFSLSQPRPYEFTNINVFKELHSGKSILAKSLKQISRNQQNRAASLWKDKLFKSFDVKKADEETFTFGKTSIAFSQPFWHGSPNSTMGTVIAVKIEAEGKTFCYSSDVNGPGTDEALDFLVDAKSDVLFLDGPSTYHPKMTPSEKESALNRLEALLKTQTRLIIDHHFLRDLNWYEYVENYELESAADFIELEPYLLEANRKKLFKEQLLPPKYHEMFEQGSPEILKRIKERAKRDSFAVELQNKTQRIIEVVKNLPS
ncbi:MAG: MBL fold metallo-hydrolase [Candidatus Hodarchaeota archaeon]